MISNRNATDVPIKRTKRLVFCGIDRYLNYGEAYEASIVCDKMSGYSVTVRVGIFRKVRKYYKNKSDMEREWKYGNGERR